MKVVSANSSEALRLAKEELLKGRFVVAPTDTIYGILADATNPEAVIGLRRLRRLSKKPFILLLPDLLWVKKLSLKDLDRALRFLRLEKTTLVMERNSRLPLHLTLGGNTLAVRIPKGGFIRSLLVALNRPLVAPSANPEGKPPATSVEEAIKYFGDKVSLYIDGGRLKSNPSTIIKLEDKGYRVLRGDARAGVYPSSKRFAVR